VIGLKIDHLLQLLVGRSAALVPPILVIAGAMIFVDSKARHLRPLRLGVIILFASVTLALASNNTLRPEHHGGLIGAYLHTGLEGLIGGIGVSILVVLGIGAAIVLITGASIGVMMRSSGRTVARAAESSVPSPPRTTTRSSGLAPISVRETIPFPGQYLAVSASVMTWYPCSSSQRSNPGTNSPTSGRSGREMTAAVFCWDCGLDVPMAKE